VRVQLDRRRRVEIGGVRLERGRRDQLDGQPLVVDQHGQRDPLRPSHHLGVHPAQGHRDGGGGGGRSAGGRRPQQTVQLAADVVARVPLQQTGGHVRGGHLVPDALDVTARGHGVHHADAVRVQRGRLAPDRGRGRRPPSRGVRERVPVSFARQPPERRHRPRERHGVGQRVRVHPTGPVHRVRRRRVVDVPERGVRAKIVRRRDESRRPVVLLRLLFVVVVVVVAAVVVFAADALHQVVVDDRLDVVRRAAHHHRYFAPRVYVFYL